MKKAGQYYKTEWWDGDYMIVFCIEDQKTLGAFSGTVVKATHSDTSNRPRPRVGVTSHYWDSRSFIGLPPDTDVSDLIKNEPDLNIIL
jgi:hypothetical protein